MKDQCGIAESDQDQYLVSKGWEKQFSCGEPRLMEMIELYESLGFEVYLDLVRAGNLPMGSDCEACLVNCSDELKTIWTRKK
ncbi:MAG: hypothetical protein HN729_07525 [Candidatus Marinimicrobia bacterium]|nr:hypothetical protein [Candidatus Neomarinimicrobiota bacterium]MBT3633976.1 hypothetical protein [Candidatus Neomarinimicrobiota bacterium]MBT3683750.1 hypothetical protein [Candidatus Neomarinimicrobiota bacterium]MBT3760630.1 hypothetical protein [Candidatus Neomarinimicrobiota bacterium]MBT3895789.1 hypothetical protein [Candidatus Neomarinimicrobiota bacterium]